MKVAITGARGFIGSNLVRYLNSKDIATVSISRGDVGPRGAQHHCLDVTSPSSRNILTQVLENCDGIVHTVGLAHKNSTSPTDGNFHQVNVRSAEIIADAAVAAKLSKVVLLSSIKAVADTSRIDEQGKPIPLNDSSSPRPVDDYGRSKLIAEDAVIRRLKETSTQSVILRPPLVYGIGQKGNLESVFKLMKKLVLLPVVVPHFGNMRSMISVDNLCDAIVSILHAAPISSGRYFLSDMELSTQDLFKAIGDAHGRRVFVVRCPTELMGLLSRIFGTESKWQKL
ncbi:MAG: NAD-dependent epimerase/dehydratase family protein [Pseudomonadota bacterium]